MELRWHTQITPSIRILIKTREIFLGDEAKCEMICITTILRPLPRSTPIFYCRSHDRALNRKMVISMITPAIWGYLILSNRRRRPSSSAANSSTAYSAKSPDARALRVSAVTEGRAQWLHIRTPKCRQEIPALPAHDDLKNGHL